MAKRSQNTLETKLQRIEARTRAEPKCALRWLMPLFNVHNLAHCFQQLDGKKAIGTDGVTKAKYGKELDSNLSSLVDRMKRNGYRPSPMRLVEIPKADGTKRPISIACTEDKVVESLMAKVLTAIYEPIFVDFSYGFRPGRTAHQAIRCIYGTLYKKTHAHVIDIDLSDYFGSIEHEKLLSILRMRIKDEAFLRLLPRFLKNGHSTLGETRRLSKGVPQGSILGPIVSNIYAHYCIDKWCQQSPEGQNVTVIRFADDLVAVAQSEDKAATFLSGLKARLSRCGLALNESKSKVVPFSRQDQKAGCRQGTFSFLGFQFYIGKSLKGNLIPKLQTDPKRMRKKLQSIKEWCAVTLHRRKLTEVWPTFQLKLRGHTNYFGVSYNSTRLSTFIYRSIQLVFKQLNRRSQRKSYNWAQFNMFLQQFGIPQPSVIHSLW